MKRRTVLASAGTALLATAGCVSDSGNDTGNSPDEPTTTESPSENDTPDQSNEGGQSSGESPGETPTVSDPDEGDNAGASFEDVPCPSFSDSADQTVCSHTGSSTGVYPAVSEVVFCPTTGDETVETLEITLHNVSGSRFGFNPHAWAIKKRTDDGWTHVAPEEWVEPWYNLEPDERYIWDLSVESHSRDQGENELSVTEDLESGTYAFQITGLLGGSPAEEDGGESTDIECIALFQVSRS